MKISVVIPMYNAETSIQRCLQSVLDQTYSGPMEVILVNDGSEDNGEAVAQAFIKQCNDPRFSFRYFSQHNQGVSKARNVGMENSVGEYIALLDSDDEWDAQKLERQIEVLNQHPAIDFLGTSRNGETLRILGKKIDRLHRATVNELFITMYPQTSTAIFKRSLFERLGGYDESLRFAEDGDFWIRYCAASHFYYLPESLVFTGNGKPHFGHSGISGHLKEMQVGNEFVLLEAKKKGLISPSFYYAMYVFGKLKYIRRLILTKTRKHAL